MTRASPQPFTAADVEQLKALWADESLLVPDVARIMQRPRPSIRSKAEGLGLPAKPSKYKSAKTTRTNDNLELVKALYAEGLHMRLIGQRLGVTRNTVRRMLVAMGVESRARPSPALPASSAPKVRQDPPKAPQTAPGNVPMRYDFRAAPVRFINTERGLPPIGERILAELSQRPLSTMTLATVLGEKEAIVGQALSVLRYEGKTYQPSPENGAGRHVAWAVKPCCSGEIGADSKASGEVFKASPAHSITRPIEEAA